MQERGTGAMDCSSRGIISLRAHAIPTACVAFLSPVRDARAQAAWVTLAAKPALVVTNREGVTVWAEDGITRIYARKVAGPGWTEEEGEQAV